MKYTNKVHLKAFWLKICLKVGVGDGEVFMFVIAALTGCTDSGRKGIDLQRVRALGTVSDRCAEGADWYGAQCTRLVLDWELSERLLLQQKVCCATQKVSLL